MALNENIKYRRMQLGMSQEYVADQLGVSRQAVAKWESAKSRPAAANLAELAALFEMSVSELTDSQEFVEEQNAQEEDRKGRQRNANMLLGRWGGVALINAGWDGYSSGLYSDVPHYWLAILISGLVLLLITSRDMNRRHKTEKKQMVLGAAMIFSIFFLPQLLPIQQNGVKYFLADIVTAACGIILSLKYWRHIWKVR